jgi:hypothetical protein
MLIHLVYYYLYIHFLSNGLIDLVLLSVKSAVFQPYYNYKNVIQCLFHVNVYNIFYFYIFRDMCTHWNYRIWSTTCCLSKKPKFLFCVLYYCSRWKLFVWISVGRREIIFIWWFCIVFSWVVVSETSFQARITLYYIF